MRRDVAELRRLIDAAGLNQTTAAKRLGMTPRAIRHYLAGSRGIPEVVLVAMRMISKGGK